MKTYSPEEIVKEVQREIAMRRNVYAKQHAAGKMTRDEGAALMLSVLSNPQKTIIDAVKDGQIHTRAQIADATGYSASSGGFANLLGQLRTLGIIDYPQQGSVVISDWALELIA